MVWTPEYSLGIQAAQKCYKSQYNNKVTTTDCVICDRVLSYKGSEWMHRLSRTCHGSYCTTNSKGPDVNAAQPTLVIVLGLTACHHAS